MAPALHLQNDGTNGPSRPRRALSLGGVGHHGAASGQTCNQRSIPRQAMQTMLIERIRRLLVDAPGIAVCESCLARSYSISLGEMRDIAAMLLRSPGFDRHDRCWSCSRNL